MFGRLMPQEGRFYEYFNEHAEQVVQGSRELAALLENMQDMERRAYNIETIEKKGDRITQATIELLHRTFITPLDREDIDRLESEADHVVRAAMAKLFRDEPDVRQLIKLKAIYELREAVTDKCEDVADIIEGIVLENA